MQNLRQPLTDREIEVLTLVAFHYTDAEIAKRLGIAESTVHTHVHHILQKLGAGTRHEAARLWLRMQGSPGQDS